MSSGNLWIGRQSVRIRTAELKFGRYEETIDSLRVADGLQAGRRTSTERATGGYDRFHGRGPKGTNRVIRGGSWNSNARKVRAAYRNNWHPSNRRNNLGFRLARAQPRAWGLAPDPAAVRSACSLVFGVSGEPRFGRQGAGRAVDAAAKAPRRPVLSATAPEGDACVAPTRNNKNRHETGELSLLSPPLPVGGSRAVGRGGRGVRRFSTEAELGRGVRS